MKIGHDDFLEVYLFVTIRKGTAINSDRKDVKIFIQFQQSKSIRYNAVATEMPIRETDPALKDLDYSYDIHNNRTFTASFLKHLINSWELDSDPKLLVLSGMI